MHGGGAGCPGPRATDHDEDVTFKITGPGTLIGVGNGDPTSHESDIGTKREAFSGLCMGIVRATKSPGEIMVEVASPGLTAAAATISTRDTTLRPQVEEWKRKVPSGGGVTGLWRPASATGPSGPDPLQLVVAGDTLFTLIQNGSALTGMLEAPGTGFDRAVAGSAALLKAAWREGTYRSASDDNLHRQRERAGD